MEICFSTINMKKRQWRVIDRSSINVDFNKAEIFGETAHFTIRRSLLKTFQKKKKITRHNLLRILIVSLKFQGTALSVFQIYIFNPASKNNRFTIWKSAIVLRQSVYPSGTSLLMFNVFSIWQTRARVRVTPARLVTSLTRHESEEITMTSTVSELRVKHFLSLPRVGRSRCTTLLKQAYKFHRKLGLCLIEHSVDTVLSCNRPSVAHICF